MRKIIVVVLATFLFTGVSLMRTTVVKAEECKSCCSTCEMQLNVCRYNCFTSCCPGFCIPEFECDMFLCLYTCQEWYEECVSACPCCGGCPQ